VTVMDKRGNTPLYEASRRGNQDLVHLLVEHGALR